MNRFYLFQDVSDGNGPNSTRPHIRLIERRDYEITIQSRETITRIHLKLKLYHFFS